MHRRHRGLDRPDQVGVGGHRKVGVDSALHAHLGGAGDVRLPGPFGDLAGGQRKGVRVTLALGEGAEPAAGVADVGEVDVPVHHERDVVADHVAAKRIGQCGNGVQRRTVGGCQGQILGVAAPGGVTFRRAQRGGNVGVDAFGCPRGQFADPVADGLPVPEGAVEVAAGVGPAALGVDRRAEIGPTQRLGRLVGLLPWAPDRVHVAGEPGFRIGQGADVTGHPRVDPAGRGLDVAGLRGEPLHQIEPGLGGDRGQVLQRRPGPFGVDVVGGQRRDTTPVVHPGAQQRETFGGRHQVGRGLDAHVRPQHQPGHRDACQELVEVGVRRGRHRGAVLGPEVLHDDFLDVPKFLVHLTDRVQGVGPLGQGLTDPDQQAGGERDGQPAGVGQGAQSHGRVLVRAAEVGQTARLEEPPGGGLQHHAHRRGHRPQPRHLRPAHHAGVEVRQQTGLLQHPDRGGPHIVQGRVVATLVEPLPGLGPARLRPIAEGEQRFFAAAFGAAAGDVNDLVGFQIHALTGSPKLAGHRYERAVVAGVATQVGDGDEDLAGVGDRESAGGPRPGGRAQAGVAHPRRTGTQIGQVLAPGGHRDGRLVGVERHPVAGPAQDPTQRGRSQLRLPRCAAAIGMAPQ